ncbi:arsenate reductase ArsC [Aurantivibrio plasticivorans]
MKRVLVLCTGNSCRSIMTEAIINKVGAGSVCAVSAGSQPAGYVHPKSLATLERHDIPCVSPQSKSWDFFEGENFDCVLTVCDRAGNETCPVYLADIRRVHWSIPDPAAAEGDEVSVDKVFDDVFLLLQARITDELMTLLEND